MQSVVVTTVNKILLSTAIIIIITINITNTQLINFPRDGVKQFIVVHKIIMKTYTTR